MDKKDIYDHLAKIYLDASSKTKRKKKNKLSAFLWRNILFASIVVIALSLFVLHAVFSKNSSNSSEISLVMAHDAVKINFNFDPAKKEAYSLNLNKQNLSRFKALSFSARKVDPKDTITLRIEFTNSFKERAEVYVRDVPARWHDYTLDFLQFRNITDWSSMSNLSFIVEAWNASDKHGVLYIDNIRLID
jgi:hypothetical protein